MASGATSDFPEARTHLRTLTLLSLFSRVAVAALVVLSASLLPLFDSSPRLVLNNSPPWISSLLRWDAFHFAPVAQKGYTYEHAWAFFPALPLLMRWSGNLLARLGFNPPDVDTSALLLGGAVLAAVCDSTRVLYRLSLYHLRSPSAAFLATALSLLSSSPATLRFAPYNEPFFTYCSHRGMWACARSRWVRAAVWFALAGALRSNGVFLAGFIGWGLVVEPWLSARRALLTPARLAYAVTLAAIPFIPFVYHNYTGYVAFCTSPTASPRPGWCDGGVFPSIYAHVQRAYWNVGFLRYWTVSNLPNFALALPVLANVYAFSWFYLSSWWHRVSPRYAIRFFFSSSFKGHVKGDKRRPKANASSADDSGGEKRGRLPSSLFLAPSLLPHVLHALAVTLLLTFNAHVQIALRVLPAHPVVYWGAAWLVVERPRWGRAWVAWSVVWGAVSCVLWAVFLPPA